MGRALIGGMLKAGALKPEKVTVTANSQASADSLAEELGCTALALESSASANRDAIGDADIVFLGVKPWMVMDTLNDIEPALADNAVVVSMAAGVSTEAMHKAVPNNPIVRIMPNTPSSIGHGVISISPDENTPQEVVDELTHMLSAAGEVFPLPEDKIGAMTGISGSGVAYFFLLAEEMVKAGEKLGLDHETSRAMVAKTIEGAGRLVAENPDPQELREAVTSKGGTTHAAITTFQDADFEGLVAKAAKAASDRADEMRQEYS